jgi:hypothetical protein
VDLVYGHGFRWASVHHGPEATVELVGVPRVAGSRRKRLSWVLWEREKGSTIWFWPSSRSGRWRKGGSSVVLTLGEMTVVGKFGSKWGTAKRGSGQCGGGVVLGAPFIGSAKGSTSVGGVVAREETDDH